MKQKVIEMMPDIEKKYPGLYEKMYKSFDDEIEAERRK